MSKFGIHPVNSQVVSAVLHEEDVYVVVENKFLHVLVIVFVENIVDVKSGLCVFSIALVVGVCGCRHVGWQIISQELLISPV